MIINKHLNIHFSYMQPKYFVHCTHEIIWKTQLTILISHNVTECSKSSQVTGLTELHLRARDVTCHMGLPATQHMWTHPVLTVARQAGTWFTYHRGIGGWVDLEDIWRWFTCWQTPIQLLIWQHTAWSRTCNCWLWVQDPSHYTTKPPCKHHTAAPVTATTIGFCLTGTLFKS